LYLLSLPLKAGQISDGLLYFSKFFGQFFFKIFLLPPISIECQLIREKIFCCCLVPSFQKNSEKKPKALLDSVVSQFGQQIHRFSRLSAPGSTN
jgi:hypothetical protein